MDFYYFLPVVVSLKMFLKTFTAFTKFASKNINVNKMTEYLCINQAL